MNKKILLLLFIVISCGKVNEGNDINTKILTDITTIVDTVFVKSFYPDSIHVFVNINNSFESFSRYTLYYVNPVVDTILTMPFLSKGDYIKCDEKKGRINKRIKFTIKTNGHSLFFNSRYLITEYLRKVDADIAIIAFEIKK